MSDEKNLRTEGAARGDETDPPSYWLLGHHLGNLYWGPRWGMDCEGNATQFPTAMAAYEQWKHLPADLRRALVLAPSWRKLRTEGATDTTEAAQRGCDGKVADGSGEHSVAAVEFAVRALDEVLPDLCNEAATQGVPARDTWVVVLRGRAMPSLYLGEGEDEWWTRDEEQARQFDFPAASALVATLQGRPFANKLTIFRRAAPVVAHDAPLSASVDAQGSLTVHLGTDEDGNVVSTMPEVRAAIEATGFRKMEPKQKLCVEDAPTRPSEPSLRVVAAAVWQEGMIYSLPRPARHHDILHKLHELGLPAAVDGPYGSLEQGFLLSDGTFVGRGRAAKLALAAGQVQKLTAPPELYSEDLW